MRAAATRTKAIKLPLPNASFSLENLQGVSSTTGIFNATFTRAAPDAYLNWNGTYYAATTNEPRFEADSTPRGLLIEGSRQNKCTNYNANPDASLTNLNKSGDAAATLTRVLDVDELAAAGLQNICTSGYVVKLDNSAGSTNAFVAPGGTVGNTNAHSLSMWARVTAGTGGLYLSGTPGDVTTFTASSYARITHANKTPLGTTEQLVVRAPAGTVVLFVLNQLEEAATVSSPIVTAGSAVTRAADNCTATYTLPVNDFSLTFTFHSKDAGTGTRYLLDARSASNEGLDVYMDSGVIYARKQLAGVPHSASKALVVAADTTYKIGVRLDSTSGVDIWVDGTIGTNAANAVDTTNGATIYIGQDMSNANQGYIDIKNINKHPSLSDADMARLTS